MNDKPPMDVLTLATETARIMSDAFVSFLRDVDRAGISQDLASDKTKALIVEASRKRKELSARLAKIRQEFEMESQ